MHRLLATPPSSGCSGHGGLTWVYVSGQEANLHVERKAPALLVIGLPRKPGGELAAIARDGLASAPQVGKELITSYRGGRIWGESAISRQGRRP